MTTQPNALYKAADLLAAHPDLPYPPYVSSMGARADLSWYLNLPHACGDDLAAQRHAYAVIVDGIGGGWDLNYEVGDRFVASRSAASGLLRLSVTVDRAAMALPEQATTTPVPA